MENEKLIKRSRRVYKTVKDIAEQYGTSIDQVYKNLKMREFEGCIVKFGTGCIRVDVDEYFETCQKVFR